MSSVLHWRFGRSYVIDTQKVCSWQCCEMKNIYYSEDRIWIINENLRINKFKKDGAPNKYLNLHKNVIGTYLIYVKITKSNEYIT